MALGKAAAEVRPPADSANRGGTAMIRNFLDAKTKRELHMHVESEEFGVLTGMLHVNDEFYPATLVEIEPGSGIWERTNEYRFETSE
jgi:hypothetical protein